jgi:predicted nucleotidyltransferase
MSGVDSTKTGASEHGTAPDPILSEMIRRLVGAFRPERIYLFGSRARGGAGPDSDYDLLMVVGSSSQPRCRLEQAAFRTLCGVGAPKDVIVLTSKEFNEKRQVVCSLAATVEREGRLVYEA